MLICTCDVFVCSKMADKEKRKLSLSLKNRFKNMSDSEFNELSKAKMPTLSTHWAMRNFIDLFREYNVRNPDSKCPEKVPLPSCSAEVLNKWLSVYVAETRSHIG